MTVVAAYHYREGERVRAVSIDEKVDCPADRSEFVWIGITDPTTAEMALLKERYDLHPLAVEDALKADQLPKVDVYGDQLFVVARTAQLDDRGVISYGETAIELCGKMGDGGGLKAAYRGGCRACQNLSRRAIRRDRAYQHCPTSPAR